MKTRTGLKKHEAQEVARPSSNARVRHYVKHGRSPNTTRAYQGDAELFVKWCRKNGHEPLPASPETVAAYVAERADAGRRPSTLQRNLAAIAKAHELAGLISPTRDPLVKETMSGIRRMLGTRAKGKNPLLIEDLLKVVAGIPTHTRGLRDRAVLLVGFAGAFRRSEVAALKVRNVTFTERGALVLIEKSKTDQEGAGRYVAIPFAKKHVDLCPVKAVQAWIERLKPPDGNTTLFTRVKDNHALYDGLTAQTVKDIVKRYAKRAGYDVTEFAGHSLRAGYVTSAYEHGAKAADIQGVTGHTDIRMVHKYIRKKDLFETNPSSNFW